ncbi:hypothetical protein AB840_04845 [Megasphaera cerevisiae DSM 20462]|uniref:Uncharacterized protein n=1 Tax=Megasphaera cerevisiae DSM 20462 TaxID=1122219 RepID=A0A0J6WU88_9FIRM|nr:hypothetical protein AB840_04845 [Megasphaera cerevisiae DSM 20462]
MFFLLIKVNTNQRRHDDRSRCAFCGRLCAVYEWTGSKTNSASISGYAAIRMGIFFVSGAIFKPCKV